MKKVIFSKEFALLLTYCGFK